MEHRAKEIRHQEERRIKFVQLLMKRNNNQLFELPLFSFWDEIIQNQKMPTNMLIERLNWTHAKMTKWIDLFLSFSTWTMMLAHSPGNRSKMNMKWSKFLWPMPLIGVRIWIYPSTYESPRGLTFSDETPLFISAENYSLPYVITFDCTTFIRWIFFHSQNGKCKIF